MKYVCYNPENGEIKAWGEATYPETQNPGYGLVLLGDGSPRTHYVKDGALIEYTEEQVAAKAAKPAYDSSWSNESFTWNDLRNLATAQADKWVEIKAQRDSLIGGGFVWDGSTFDSDEVSQGRITGGVVLAQLADATGQPFSKTWVLADNTTRVLSSADMMSVGVTLGNFVQDLINIGDGLRTQINATTSVADMESITWPL